MPVSKLRFNRRYALLFVTVVYWIMTIISWVANQGFVPSIEQVVNSESACFRSNALLIYVECRGFTGAGLAEFVLGIYWGQVQTLYMIVIGLQNMTAMGLSEVMFFGSAIFTAGLMWLPLIYPFWFAYTRDAY